MKNETHDPAVKKARRKKRRMIIFLSILVFLVIVRVILPYVVLKYVNKTLSNLKEYTGHVEDIDLALIRGAYKINRITLTKKDSSTQKPDTIPFFKARQLDLSVEWRAIFKGSLVGEIYVEDPVLNFVKGKHKNEDAKADTADFRDLIKNLMPLTINHFQINNGQLHYIDKYAQPNVDVAMKEIEVKADNLSNVNDSAKILPARLKASAKVYDGTFDLTVKFNALEKKPTFDLDASISGVNMVDLNNFFEAYGKFKVDKGSFGLYTEFAAKDGAFKGYVKPLIKNIDINHDGNFGQIVWSEVVSAGAWVFKNHKKDQVATELPVEGRFDKPDPGLWTAITYVLKNAFVFALRPSVDNKIDIGKVESQPEKKGFFKKLFGKKNKKHHNKSSSKKK